MICGNDQSDTGVSPLMSGAAHYYSLENTANAVPPGLVIRLRRECWPTQAWTKTPCYEV